MSLSTRILIGLLVGIATGLFFGELVADLKLVGDVFVKLLQITVLPYIVASLIAGFGRMEMSHARKLAVRGTAALLVIWGLALVIIFIAPLAFPDLDAASFFGSPSPNNSNNRIFTSFTCRLIFFIPLPIISFRQSSCSVFLLAWR